MGPEASVSRLVLDAGLDPGSDPPLPGPRFGAIAGLGIAAQHWGSSLGTTDPDIVGGRQAQFCAADSRRS